MLNRIIYFFLTVVSLTSCENKREGKKESIVDSTGWKPISPPKGVISKLDSSTSQLINTDSLEYLIKFIGKKPASVNLWETQPLKSKLEKILRSEFAVFKDFMKDAKEIKQDKVLYTYSTIPDGVVRGLAYLIIDIKQNKISVAIILGRVRSDFESKGTPIYVPGELQKELKKIGF